MTSTCHTPCIHAPQRLRVELEQQILTHDSEETLGKAAPEERGTTDQRKHHLTAIGSGGETRTTSCAQSASGATCACKHSVAGALDVITSAYFQVNGVRYRRRSVTGQHAITIHRRHMEYQHSRGMFLRFGLQDCR